MEGQRGMLGGVHVSSRREGVTSRLPHGFRREAPSAFARKLPLARYHSEEGSGRFWLLLTCPPGVAWLRRAP